MSFSDYQNGLRSVLLPMGVPQVLGVKRGFNINLAGDVTFTLSAPGAFLITSILVGLNGTGTGSWVATFRDAASGGGTNLGKLFGLAAAKYYWLSVGCGTTFGIIPAGSSAMAPYYSADFYINTTVEDGAARTADMYVYGINVPTL